MTDRGLIRPNPTQRGAASRGTARPAQAGEGASGVALRMGPVDGAALASVVPAAGSGGKVTVVTDVNVHKALADTLTPELRGAGLDPAWIIVDAGERSRSMERLVDLLTARRTRKEHGAPLVALGGGVVADLTGALAALTDHGSPWVVVPTSLTAMADPPRDGRVGLALKGIPEGVALTHPPLAVLLDPSLLASLPKRQVQSGMGVVLRRAAARDKMLFRYAVDRAEAVAARDAETLAYLVEHVAALTPGRDGHELLRPGAPLAALVQRLDRARNHGEAAAVGLAMIADLSVAHGFLDPTEREELVSGLRVHHLPFTGERFLDPEIAPLLEWGTSVRGRVEVTVLEGIGRARVAKLHVNDLNLFARGGR